jgi:hypothetical protein
MLRLMSVGLQKSRLLWGYKTLKYTRLIAFSVDQVDHFSLMKPGYPRLRIILNAAQIARKRGTRPFPALTNMISGGSSVKDRIALLRQLQALCIRMDRFIG